VIRNTPTDIQVIAFVNNDFMQESFMICLQRECKITNQQLDSPPTQHK